MRAVGLTGGIGSGKSAVADLLVDRGAELLDADEIARQVVAPDGPAYQPLLVRFGPGILAPDGTIERPALAAAAFGDPQALADLNAITHPAIGAEMLRRRQEVTARGDDTLLVLAIPLLRSVHRQMLELDAVVVVDCPEEVALRRLVERRGMSEADAEARIAAQISRRERCEGADFVLDNSSTVQHLTDEVERLWRWVQARRPPTARAAHP